MRGLQMVLLFLVRIFLILQKTYVETLVKHDKNYSMIKKLKHDKNNIELIFINLIHIKIQLKNDSYRNDSCNLT